MSQINALHENPRETIGIMDYISFVRRSELSRGFMPGGRKNPSIKLKRQARDTN